MFHIIHLNTHILICTLKGIYQKKMAQFVNGYINDLSAVKDNVILRVRVLRNWMQPVFGKSHIINMELIVMDEQASQFDCF